VKPLRDLLPPNLPPKFAFNLLSNRFRQSVLNEWVEESGGTAVWHEDVADDQVDDKHHYLRSPPPTRPRRLRMTSGAIPQLS
jgi:hypothetical protein